MLLTVGAKIGRLLMRTWILTWAALWSIVVNAEPSASVKYLMNQPVSAMDFGLYRLGQELSSDLGTNNGWSRVTATASYDWNRNRIVVTMLSLAPNATTAATAKKYCRTVIDLARQDAGVSPVTGTVLPDTATVASLFLPDSFPNTDQPENISDELLSIIEIRVTVRVIDVKVKNIAQCEGKLLSADTLFKE
jgi:hypothetical protein